MFLSVKIRPDLRRGTKQLMLTFVLVLQQTPLHIWVLSYICKTGREILFLHSILRRFLGRKYWPNGISSLSQFPTDSGRKATSLASFLFYATKKSRVRRFVGDENIYEEDISNGVLISADIGRRPNICIFLRNQE